MYGLSPFCSSPIAGYCGNFTPATQHFRAEIFGRLITLSNDSTALQNKRSGLPDNIQNEILRNDNKIRNKEKNINRDLMFAGQLNIAHKHPQKRSTLNDRPLISAKNQDETKPGFAVLANLRNTGTTANEQDAYGFTALMAIAQENRSTYQLMQSILVIKKPDINLVNYLGNTALHHAIISEAPKIAKLYVDYGADVNIVNILGQTPYMLAKKYEFEDLMHTLATRGAQTKEVKQQYHPTPLLISLTERNDTLSSYFINRKNTIDIPDRNGRTPLMYTIILNKKELFKQLVHQRANLELRDKSGSTALLIAARLGRVKMANYLLHNGAISNVVDYSAMTAMMHDMQKGNTKIAIL